MSKSDEQRGWYIKYRIIKANGRLTDPEADYFVLRLDTDHAAQAAARMYAAVTENQKLARDLLERIKKHEEKKGGEK